MTLNPVTTKPVTPNCVTPHLVMMSRTRRKRLAAAALAGGSALTLALTACSSSGSSSTKSTPPAGSGSKAVAAAPNSSKPTVLLDWFPNPDHASLYTAKTRGYWKSAGLSGVTLQAPSGNQDALKLVSTGSMALGISYAPNVINAVSQGVDVVAVGALIPTPLDTLLISSKSGIKTVAGLKGKKIGTYGDPTSTAILDNILKKNGVDPKSTSQITVSEGLIPAMLTGNVQAIIGGYRNVEDIQLKLKGQTPVMFTVEQQGIPTYDELVIIAQKSRLAKDAGYRAMVKDFLAGLAKGDAAAQADPNAAIAALKPYMKAGDYSDQDLTAMTPVTTALYKNPAGFGQMDTAKWQTFSDWMLQNKLIKKSVKASDVETTAYLPSS